jgi:hypothetical protein
MLNLYKFHAGNDYEIVVVPREMFMKENGNVPSALKMKAQCSSKVMVLA